MSPKNSVSISFSDWFRSRWTVLALLAGAVVAAIVAVPDRKPGEATGGGEPEAAAEAMAWTCSMCPTVRLTRPGRCPLCDMDLVQERDSGGGGERSIALSEAARRRAGIETAVVERRFVDAEIRLVGKVAHDDSLVREVSVWIPGQIDRLFVESTGVRVEKGDPLLVMYSPELFTTEMELLVASRRIYSSGGARQERGVRVARLAAIRQKLRLWGLSSQQVYDIELSGVPSDHITIFAPIGGVVVSIPTTEGTYRKQGSALYTIADLSRVWLILEAYEGDLGRLRLGQTVRFETAAYPGWPFVGRISVVDSTLDPRTRTAQVRVEVDNPEGRLKPGMFARASVRATLGAGGEVVGPNLAGRWLCRVHPAEVADEGGVCPRCESDLVRAESLGYVAGEEGVRPPIVVPVTAVLQTGRRSVVYVETRDGEEVRYEGREVVLGPRAGSRYVVEAGLAEGERVVSRGNFKIDSALQIRARPSMMSAPGERDPRMAPFRRALEPVYRATFDLVEALAADRLNRVWRAGESLREALAGIDEDAVRARRRARWVEIAGRLDEAVRETYDADSLEAARVAFEKIAAAVIELEVEFGHEGEAVHRRVFCPMAFDGRGGEWLDESTVIRNPYYGATMLRCGREVEAYPGVPPAPR